MGDIEHVSRRIYFAGVVLGATLAAAIWLYTYRVWSIVEYIDRAGRHFHPSERVRVQPWWGVPATVALIVFGVGVSLRLLPGRRGPMRRLADHFANLSKAHLGPTGKAGEAGLSGGRTDAGGDAKRHRPYSGEHPPTTAS